jgi:hypothetical protein
MKKVLFLLNLFIISFFSLRAQGLDSMIKVYSEQVPEEKVYVHFDKDVYMAGETIWFKGYLFSGFSLAVTSKNFYAELINDKGVVLQRKVYPIVESATVGNFDLPDSLPAGNLIYRGYTTWMLNFDTAFIFQKNIIITNKNGIADSKKSVANAQRKVSLQFFPEGGNLVNTLESVVAFKANDEYGLPFLAKGNIISNKGAVVASFSSVHDGMGTFTLTPQANETYQAVWTDAEGKQQTTPLPEAKAQGCVLKMSGVGKKKVFLINRTADVPAEWKNVYIIGLLGQERVYRAKANLEMTQSTSGAIPVDNFPSGILQVTVFSDKWEPIAERIVEVNNDNYHFDAQVNTPELNTNFRAKNTFEIEVDDTLLSNLSLSVTDAAIGRETYADNIYSRVLLTGDIKGYVHNPAYYFSNNSDSLAAQLDLVMLTHGWRRYNWANLARGKKPVLKYPDESYLSLEARVFGVTTASPLRSDEELGIFLQQKDSSTQFLQMKKVGPDKFSIPNLVFYDTASLHYQFMKDKKAEQEMSLSFGTNLYKGVKKIDVANRPVNIQVDTSILSRTKFLADKLSRYGNRFAEGGAVLQTVTVKAKVKNRLQELEDKYASGLFKGGDGYSFDLTSEPVSGMYDIFSYLQGKVAGLQITGTGANASVSWRGSRTSLFLNEMPGDPSMLASVNINDIAYIKVLRPPFMGGFGGGAGGAIAIYTKKGNDARPTNSGRGLAKTIVTGYSSAKEFYSPNYKDLSASADVVADYRSTLYWNPVILTDSTRKKVRVEFYNNDITKAYRVVLEGVNEIGKMVRIEKVIQQGK